MKKILSLGLALVMLFALVGCNGRETESKLAALEAKLQEQSSKIDELEEEKDNLLGQITQLQGEIGGLQGEVERLEEENEEMFNYLCAANSVFYGIESAYKEGWITREELKCILYEFAGSVYEGTIDNENKYLQGVEPDSSWIKLDFDMTLEYKALDTETERKMQGAIAYRVKDEKYWSGKIEDAYECIGMYKKYVFVYLTFPATDSPSVTEYAEIDGLVYCLPYDMPYIWKEN